MLGTRGHGVLSGYALGSVALRVGPAARCSVVLVKPQAQLPVHWGEPQLRAMVAVDGSAAAEQALRRLVESADFLGLVHVDLVHVGPALSFAAAILPPHDDVLRSWSGRQAEEALAPARQRLAAAGIAHEVHRLTGEPADSIAQLARQRQADLIVVGSHGKGALRRSALGSVSLRTAHLGHVPVALMR